MKTQKIEVEQTIFVIEKWFSKPEDNELQEYIVTKIESDSFYARKEGTRFEVKFEMDTMQHKSVGDVLTAYLSEEEHWDITESKSLKKEIINSLDCLDTQTLRKIKSLIHV